MCKQRLTSDRYRVVKIDPHNLIHQAIVSNPIGSNVLVKDGRLHFPIPSQIPWGSDEENTADASMQIAENELGNAGFTQNSLGDLENPGKEIQIFAPDKKRKIHSREQVLNRDAQILALRSKGLTLDQIGVKFDITRERVRQILVKNENFFDPILLAKKRRSARERNDLELRIKLFQSITKHWPRFSTMTFHGLAKDLQTTERQVRRSISPIQYVTLQANQESKISQVWTEEHCLKVLRLAATYAFPLTVLEYRRLIDSHTISGPSVSLIWGKFGSWINACENAGVEFGETYRDYDRSWTDIELLRLVREFMHTRSDAKWSKDNYERWRRDQVIERPSAALLRLRLGSWSEVRLLALNLKMPDFDMHSFTRLEP